MYAIRPAEFADLPAIQHLRVARARWATRKGIGTPQYRQLTQAEKKTAHPLVVTWDGEVIATTTLIDQPPYAGWTRRELAQRAIGLVRVITTPSPEHCLSWLLTSWAVDHAARSDHEWIRICVPAARLAGHWCTDLGWEYVRSHREQDKSLHLLQRPAERMPGPGLAALIEDRVPMQHSLTTAVRVPWSSSPDLYEAFLTGCGRTLTETEEKRVIDSAVGTVSGIQFGVAHGDPELVERGWQTLVRLRAERGPHRSSRGDAS